MTRTEKVKFLIDLINEVEGTLVDPYYFESYTDKKLEKEISFYEYVSEK